MEKILRTEKDVIPEIDPSEILFGERIGEGTYGCVFRGKCRGKEVAIKVFKRKEENLSDSELEKFREEVKIMSKIPHPNVVLFMGACTMRGKDLMIVTDLLPTDMETLLLKQRRDMTLFQKITMAKEAALGMNWLHCSNPIFIHRDLKLSNLLVNDQLKVFVCDFGLAQMKPRNVANLDYDPHGSPIYMAPEVFVGEFNEKCDIYSFGICLWEMLVQRQAFSEMEDDLAAFIHSICDLNARPSIPSSCPRRLTKLITDCWAKDPLLRPSFGTILDELEKLLIELAIEEDGGRKMWRKYLFGMTKIKWEDFIVILFRTLRIDLPLSERDPFWDLLQTIGQLVVQDTVQINNDTTVTMQNFGNLLSYFGPLRIEKNSRDRDESFLLRIQNIVRQPWFHGRIGEKESTSRLNSGKEGDYLVRMSSSPAYFTISNKTKKDSDFRHTRVRYIPGEGFFLGSANYQDLPTLLKAEGKQHCWKSPLTVKKFLSLYS